MNTQKEELIASVTREIERKTKALKRLEVIPVNELSEQFGGHWWLDITEKFELSMPYDFAMIGKVKEYMAEKFPDFRISREKQYIWNSPEPAAGYSLEYETTEEDWWERTCFDIMFRSGNKGSTCVLNKIGEEVVPVFEVICADGAKEGW